MARIAFFLTLLCSSLLALAATRPIEPLHYGELWLGNFSFSLGTAYNYGGGTKYITFTTPSKGQPLLARDDDNENELIGGGEFRPSLVMTGYYESVYAQSWGNNS